RRRRSTWPRCSPTRAALMTGHQNQRVGFNVLAGNGNRLDKNHVFLPEVLRDNGYKTYLSGKWHLGSTDNFGSLGPIPGTNSVDPRVRGFDHAFTFTASSHSERNWVTSDYRMLNGAGGSFPSTGDRYIEDTDGDYNRYDAAGQYTPLPDGDFPEFYQTDAIADYAIDFLDHHRAQNNANDSNDPFFQYVAFGAPHFPIEAPTEVTNRYATVRSDGTVTGQFAAGWDAVRDDRLQGMIQAGVIPEDLIVSPRGDAYQSPSSDGGRPELIAWNEVPAARKPTLVRAMAVYAAMVDVVDQNVGRIVDNLVENGDFDNTLIMFMTDNGANAEGDVYGLGNNPQQDDPPGSSASLNDLLTMGAANDTDSRDQRIGTAWANVSATPYRNYKHHTHEGGIKSPLIVSWPNGLHESLVGTTESYVDGNNDVMHVTDVMPTLLDLLDLDLPENYTSIDGETYDVVNFNRTTESWAGLLTDGNSLGEREFGIEHEGNRMYRIGDWKIVSSNFAGNDGDETTPNNTIANGESPTLIAAHEWELYNLALDPTE
ncbi:MAG: sulfatase-like hydrolase/transferase, partial [Planctomycetota bacterium]